MRTGAKTASCPGYLPWKAVTDRRGRFELRGVPSGDYLLVIGSDLPADLTRPTVHDHVKLSGGTQRLRAPTLPTIPCTMRNYVQWCQGVMPSPDVTPFPRPRVERDGSYRLTTIDPTREKPCAIAFDAQRAHRHLPLVVVDEWLTENSREINAYRDTVGPRIPQPTPYLTSSESVGTGGNNCAELIGGAFLGAPNRAADPRTRWFAGTWYDILGVAAGSVLEYPRDPRAVEDLKVGPWP